LAIRIPLELPVLGSIEAHSWTIIAAVAISHLL
jgi:hypothetical protein